MEQPYSHLPAACTTEISENGLKGKFQAISKYKTKKKRK